jgi:curved DNA-binding protein CbpA
MSDGDDIRRTIEDLHAGLSRLAYQSFLGVVDYAGIDTLREAFRDRGSRLHPDRLRDEDPRLQAKAHAVYRRMNEAFFVLSNPELAKLYRQARAAGQHRLLRGPRGEWIDPPSRVTVPGAAVVGDEARRHYLSALDAERLGEPARAWLHIKQALALEPDNATLQEKMEKYK